MVFEIWRGSEAEERVDAVYESIVENYEPANSPGRVLKLVKRTLSYLCSRMSKRWEESKGTKERFLRNNAIWLESKVHFGGIKSPDVPTSSKKLDVS